MKSIFLLGFMLFIGTVNAQTNTSPEGKKFKVDDVEIAPGPLWEMGAKQAFERELTREIQFFPDELKNQMVAPGWGNNFVSTIHKSYDQHRPLSLSPDVIWLVIAQGVSIHINENFKELESHIFKADKPDKITVRNDDLADGSVHWMDLLSAFSDSTTKYVNDDYYSFFVPEFSTTTNVDMTCYEVTMLQGFSQAFKYFGDSGCGIPYITLRGNREDWEAIYERLDKIEELGLTVWAEELRMVLQKFIDAFDDTIDVDFWQSMYKDHSEYGADYVSGWFIKFFPYLEGSGESESIETENPYIHSRAPKTYYANTYIEGNRYLISKLGTNDFPSGMAEIDIHWDDWGTKREMKVHAGFYGSKQYEDLSLEPAIAWAVLNKAGSEANHDYDRIDYDIEHRHVYWSPEALSGAELIEKAIYSLETYSDSKASYSFVKKTILDHLKTKTRFTLNNLKGKTVQLLISSKGTILESKGEELDENLLSEITRAVQSLPKTWNPAQTDFRKIAPQYYNPNDDGKIVLVPVNSWVSIEF